MIRAKSANNAPSTNDFSGGTIDALINYLCVGRGRGGNSSVVGGSGVMTFNGGSLNVNTLAIGFIYPSGSNSPAFGTLNVNGLALLTVNSNLFLAQAANVAGQTAFPQATLNVNGGTIQAANIVGGGGTATINLNGGQELHTNLKLSAGGKYLALELSVAAEQDHSAKDTGACRFRSDPKYGTSLDNSGFEVLNQKYENPCSTGETRAFSAV